MATLNAVILASKSIKGGKNKVRISVAHNGQTRYIVTDIVLDSEKEFRNGRVVKRPDAAYLNTKIRQLLIRYQSTIDSLGYINGLSCPELVYQIQNGDNDKNRTLKSIYEEYMRSSSIKCRTFESYQYYWRRLESFFGDKMLIKNMNHAKILALEKDMKNDGLKASSIRTYLLFLRTLTNFARKCGYCQSQIDPFVNYRLPTIAVGQSWLTVDEVLKIRDLQTTKKNIIKCRDLFMLSYYLGGINIVDLLEINFKQQNGVLKYIRKKTEGLPKANKFVEFNIPEEALPIIKKYIGQDGRIYVTMNQRKTHCQSYFFLNMPKLAKAAGVERVIYYSARKSFSQHAYNLGISEKVIDYILGHRVDRGSTALYHYISVTPEMATAAIRKVLDNLK